MSLPITSKTFCNQKNGEDHSDVDDQVEPIDDIGSGIEYEEDIGMDDDLELVDDYGDMDLDEPEPSFDFDSVSITCFVSKLSENFRGPQHTLNAKLKRKFLRLRLSLRFRLGALRLELAFS